ncbi:T9SS type A sorting domain-containing protein [bacterium]|nr:T9SS type A sorting domain-containing protein [bacterium]
MGFHLYRSKINLLSHAVKITPVAILATNSTQEYVYSYTDNEVELNTNYFYWLQILESDHNNFFGPVGAKLSSQENDHDIEETLLGNKLFANYPNPFNPTTTISFSVEKPCQVSIDLFNLKGQFIKKIFNQFVHVPNKKHNTVWDGRDSQGKKVASGIYFAHIKAGAFTKTTKMLLTK